MAFRDADRARRHFWVWATFGLALAVWLADRPTRAYMATAVAALGMIVAFAPTLRHQLLARRIPAMDEQFVTLRPVLPALVDACRRHPGVVSNNFRLTPEDIERVAATLDLIGRPAGELPQRASYVDYVLARLVEPAESEDPALFSELLNTAGDAAEPGYRSIVEVGVDQPDGSRVDFLGLFAVPIRSPASSPDT
jgi:hypothetical protein